MVDEVNSQNNPIPVFKAKNEELKQATFVVLAPDEVDHHGDTYDTNEVRKACHNYNKHCRVANLLHLQETTSFEIAESYVTPVEMQYGDTVVKAGSWMAVLQFTDDTIWEGVKDGSWEGVSIGANAQAQDLIGDDNG